MSFFYPELTLGAEGLSNARRREVGEFLVEADEAGKPRLREGARSSLIGQARLHDPVAVRPGALEALRCELDPLVAVCLQVRLLLVREDHGKDQLAAKPLVPGAPRRCGFRQCSVDLVA